MALIRISASADTTITNASKAEEADAGVYANIGAADSLEIFSLYAEDAETKKSRILIKFDNSKFIDLRNAGILPASGSVSYHLVLHNVQHAFTTPESISVDAIPLSSSWEEGYGLDLDNYTDIGIYADSGAGANWIYRKLVDGTMYPWDTPGGDFLEEYKHTSTIEGASSNIEIDITDVIEDQISEVIENNGFVVKLNDSQELDNSGTNYFTKRVSARTSQYFYSRPYIEARWDSSIKDNRNNFYYVSPNLEDADNSGSIFFYNKVAGRLKNLPGDVIPQVKIELDGDLVVEVESQKIAAGTYKATFALTGTQEAEFSDVWYSGSSAYYTGSVNVTPREFEQNVYSGEYHFAITNLKPEYSSGEVALLKIFSRKKDWSPTIYSVASKDIENYTHNNLYYRVYRLEDNYSVIDYGYPPENATCCSSDTAGNYFMLDMSLIEPGYTYAIRLSLYEDGRNFEDPNIYRFKVTRHESR